MRLGWWVAPARGCWETDVDTGVLDSFFVMSSLRTHVRELGACTQLRINMGLSCANAMDLQMAMMNAIQCYDKPMVLNTSIFAHNHKSSDVEYYLDVQPLTTFCTKRCCWSTYFFCRHCTFSRLCIAFSKSFSSCFTQSIQTEFSPLLL